MRIFLRNVRQVFRTLILTSLAVSAAPTLGLAQVVQGERTDVNTG